MSFPTNPSISMRLFDEIVADIWSFGHAWAVNNADMMPPKAANWAKSIEERVR